MSILEVLRPQTRNSHETFEPHRDALERYRQKLGEAALEQVCLNNDYGIPTEHDQITGKRKSFAQINAELNRRNEHIGLHPLPGAELPVDGVTDLAKLEEMYPPDTIYATSRR